jgi:NAD(P)-dependent dehydrogenase (short-subunit alcohol dehydrogenase family)
MTDRVLITGCSTGIGRACAIGFTAAGYDVVATARHLGAIEDLKVAERIRLDVTKRETIETAVARAGDIDVLINNAGTSLWGPVEEVPIEDAQDLFDANVWGALRVFQSVAPSMRKRGRGRVVNVSSLAARSGGPMLGFYSASKAALSRFSEAMRREVEPYGVLVSAIELAGVESDFPKNRTVVECADSGYQEALREMQVGIARSRANAVTPDKVAEWILEIVRDEKPAASYMVSLDQQVTRSE